MHDLLRDRFVAVGIDIGTFQKRQDAEGAFFRRFRQAFNEKHDTPRFADQGVYLCDTAGGNYNLPSAANRPELPTTVDELKQVLDRFRPVEVPIESGGRIDETYWAVVPEGGSVVRVVIGEQGASGYRDWDRQRDNLWITAEESRSLAQGNFPASLKERLVRFHLVLYGTCHPVPWEPSEVKRLDLTLQDGLVRGNFLLERAEDDFQHGAPVRFEGTLLGRTAADDGRPLQFDLVVRGERIDWYIDHRTKPVTQTMSLTLVTDPRQDHAAQLIPAVLQGGYAAKRLKTYLLRQR